MSEHILQDAETQDSETQGKKVKLWSGRFDKETDKTVEEFMSSLSLDKRLYNEDIKVSMAHIKMLSAAELVTAAEAKTISAALLTIKQEIENDDLLFLASDEDIHMAIERVLIEKVGDVGGKLHTARSRNDQVVTDVRLFLKKSHYSNRAKYREPARGFVKSG